MRLNNHVIPVLLLSFSPVSAHEDADRPYYTDHVDGCYVEMCGVSARQEDTLRELAREIVDELKGSPPADDPPRRTEP